MDYELIDVHIYWTEDINKQTPTETVFRMNTVEQANELVNSALFWAEKFHICIKKILLD